MVFFCLLFNPVKYCLTPMFPFKEDLCLESSDQMCKHNVISLPNMSYESLGFPTDEAYPKDPHCESTREDCAACSSYLSTFLNGCKNTKSLPPKGTVSTELPFCGSCKTKVIDALSDA